MNNDAFENLLRISKAVFYTDFLLAICQLIAIIIIIFYSKNNKHTILFLAYCCSAFVLIFSGWMGYYINSRNDSLVFFEELNSIIFAVVEYIVFYAYFKEVLISKLIKKIMFLFYMLFILVIIIFLLISFSRHLELTAIYRNSNYIISTELLFLAFLCLIYYFELFRKKPVNNLTQSPSFWIITSLFFYSIIITPFFMIINEDFIISHKNIYYALFAFHYISFSFLFLAIVNAFLCRRPLTT